MVKSFTATDKKLPAGPGSKPGQTGPLSVAEGAPASVHRAARLMQAGAAVSTVSLIFTVIGAFSLKHNMLTANAQKVKAQQLTFPRRFPSWLM